MSKVAFLYKNPLSSVQFNQRFGDILGNSVLSGFRFQKGSGDFKVSLVTGTDSKSLLVTKTGVRIEEENDLVDVIEIEPNIHGSIPRLDRVYAKYEHGDRDAVVYYVVSKGLETGEPAMLEDETTHTLLGEISVPANNAALIDSSFVETGRGLRLRDVGYAAHFKELVEFDGPVLLHNQPTEDEEVVNKKYVDDNVYRYSGEVLSANVASSNYEEDGQVFTSLEYKRPDGTLHLKSTLAERNEEGKYGRVIIEYYDPTGKIIVDTQEWALVYDTYGNLISKNLL